MNIYLLTQDEATGYDTYDSMVVCAETEEAARQILPADYMKWNKDEHYPMWATKPENVDVTLLGVATEGRPAGVICASFNAG